MSCPLYKPYTNGRISLNLNDTFTSTRGCAEPMLPMCQLKVKVTVNPLLLIAAFSRVLPLLLIDAFSRVFTRLRVKSQYHFKSTHVCI